MNILITGAKGFAGKNLVESLKNIRDGKDRTHPELQIGEVFEFGSASSQAELEEYCGKADFVFHLAGANRPPKPEQFMQVNCGFTQTLLATLEARGNHCPVMYASSVQATLEGRFAGSEYGKSKQAGENAVFEHGKRGGGRTLVYRLPNLFGKWCKPNYNSAVATFCYNTAHDLPITVNDRSTDLELLYIDDFVEEMLFALNGREHRDGLFCKAPVTHRATLGEIADDLAEFRTQPETLRMPEIPEGSFEKKLYSTYLSYLPREKAAFPLKMNVDARGSFTELMKTKSCGQFSVNISKPGITKGQHWHNTKWEFFMVVSGHGLIQQRKISSEDIMEFYVSGEKIEAVHMLPGYTHNIINLSETDDLVTVMWANECFDPEHPDTFSERV